MPAPIITLYMMLGLPGAGKTTTARYISDITHATHLSSDVFRLEMFNNPTFSQKEHDSLYKTLDYITKHLLQQDISVIYDANLNRYIHRKQKYDMCRKLKVRPVLVWVEVPKETAKQRRIGDQNHLLVPQFEAPEAMFERIADVFEPPHPNEPYIKVDGTKVTHDYIASVLNAYDQTTT